MHECTQRCAVSTVTPSELGYELVTHPPYFSDLVPNDYLLFPQLIKWIVGKRFSSNNEIIDQINVYFIDPTILEGIKNQEKYCTKCIHLKEDCDKK